ncbi:carboxypeptidase-like regulatory domain-containing protein [Puteibacter caeruleilacunae]|nr:carboxypeptidase-like regulatory domain-containing protein [Puteibacter caeruleilacunae]
MKERLIVKEGITKRNKRRASKMMVPVWVTMIFVFLGGFVEGSNISGIIRDAKTHEPLPFVNIVVENTMTGTMTDVEGNFHLEVKDLPCKLLVKFIGYKSQLLTIDIDHTILKIDLEEEIQELAEVTVKPDIAYDLMLLRKIIKNRKKNNPDNIERLYYKDYSRTSAFLSNYDKKKVKKSKIWQKAAGAIVEATDSTVMIPFFINEEISLHNRDQDQGIDETKHLVEKSDGVLSEINQQVKHVLSQKITTEFNFYDNQINVLSRGFPSPIAATSLLYYKVYVTDSCMHGDTKHYKFEFYPKSYKNVTFKGYFWVDSKDWALTKIAAALPNSANINFVSNLVVEVDYQKVPSGKWFYKDQKVHLNLSILKDEEGKKERKNLAVQRVNIYSDFQDEHVAGHAIATRDITQFPVDSILTVERATAPLDTFERAAYDGIKTIKATPFFKFVDKFSAMTLNGYYNVGKFDLGPYFAFYRKNAIEGNRVSIPLRTSSKMFDNFMLGGMLGYGFKNKKFAYSGDIAYQFKTSRRTVLKGHYYLDYFDLTRNKFIEFIRENPYQQGNGNVLSPFTTKELNPYMIRKRHADVTLERDIDKNIGIVVRPSFTRYYANQNVHFLNQGVAQSHFDVQSLLVDTRFSFGQEFDERFFARIYYGNQKPIFHLSALVGRYSLPKALSNKDGWYANFNLSVKDRFNMGPAFVRMLTEVGGGVGDVPYPLLKLPRGSRDIGSARYYFNLLHHASYASDFYVSTHWALNGGGLLFNKLPLIRGLNLREIIAFKGFYGKLLGDHNKVITIPDYLRAPHKDPYMEISAGVTNIFKVLRIEYVSRINSGKSFDRFSSKNGIRVRLEVNF